MHRTPATTAKPSRRSLIAFGAANLAVTLFTRYGGALPFGWSGGFAVFFFCVTAIVGLNICTIVCLVRTWPAYRVVWVVVCIAEIWCIAQVVLLVVIVLWAFGAVR